MNTWPAMWPAKPASTSSFPSLDKSASPHESELDYQMIGWRGRCEVHEKFTVEDIRNVREQFPDVFILAHPECSPEVVEASDFSGSTSAMIRYVQNTAAPRYLLLTECSMGDNITAANPEKNMLRMCSVRCPHMNQITMENTLDSLKYNQIVVEVPEEIRVRAVSAVERMLRDWLRNPNAGQLMSSSSAAGLPAPLPRCAWRKTRSAKSRDHPRSRPVRIQYALRPGRHRQPRAG